MNEIMKNEIEYSEVNGYKFPTLKGINEKDLSYFGKKKLEYLKQKDIGIYFELLANNELFSYLNEFEKTANTIYDKLVFEFKSKWNVNEKLKEENQMKWIQLMNNIDNIVKEIILNEYVYRQ